MPQCNSSEFSDQDLELQIMSFSSSPSPTLPFYSSLVVHISLFSSQNSSVLVQPHFLSHLFSILWPCTSPVSACQCLQLSIELLTLQNERICRGSFRSSGKEVASLFAGSRGTEARKICVAWTALDHIWQGTKKCIEIPSWFSGKTWAKSNQNWKITNQINK